MCLLSSQFVHAGAGVSRRHWFVCSICHGSCLPAGTPFAPSCGWQQICRYCCPASPNTLLVTSRKMSTIKPHLGIWLYRGVCALLPPRPPSPSVPSLSQPCLRELLLLEHLLSCLDCYHLFASCEVDSREGFLWLLTEAVQSPDPLLHSSKLLGTPPLYGSTFHCAGIVA